MARSLATASLVAGVVLGLRGSLRAAEPVVGGPCEGCEDVFAGLPDSLAWSSTIAPEREPGQRMRIDGTVRDGEGRPVPGVIVYAYHTNAKGLYPQSPHSRHGRLRGWARTDEQGRYRFDTIRPAGYPNSDLPAHVHMHVIEVGRCTYVIDDIQFEDDPRLSAAHRRMAQERGGAGIVTPRRAESGRWLVTRDIVLGEHIPDYEDCGR
jgi:protocatechuate 3,4-dioxygenase beta subunit